MSFLQGNFDCLNFKGRFIQLFQTIMIQTDFLTIVCSEDVGLVFQTVFYASSFGAHFERRLADFYIGINTRQAMKIKKAFSKIFEKALIF